MGLSKEAADRFVDKIISHFNQDSPRGMEQMTKWNRAKEKHVDVRAALGEKNWKPRELGILAPLEEQPLAGREFSASALFPTEWWKTLSVDLIAELVVDAFSSAFVDPS